MMSRVNDVDCLFDVNYRGGEKNLKFVILMLVYIYTSMLIREIQGLMVYFEFSLSF